MSEGLRKRSVTLRGHATSFTIEEEFLAELRRLAEREECSLAALIARVDAERAPARNLSSALRVHVLAEMKKAAGL